MDGFRTLLSENEDFLIGRLLVYTKGHGYAPYTSTLEELTNA